MHLVFRPFVNAPSPAPATLTPHFQSAVFLTLFEAVLQHFCSSTLCSTQGRGSTLVSLFRQKLLWRHNVTLLSKSSFYISSLTPITFTCHSRPLHCGGYCIPMNYKSSLESSCSNIQLIRTVHFAVLRHMLLGIFIQPCSHVGYCTISF